MAHKPAIFVLFSGARSRASAFYIPSKKTLLRSAGYGLMSMFVSCGVGAQDLPSTAGSAQLVALTSVSSQL